MAIHAVRSSAVDGIGTVSLEVIFMETNGKGDNIALAVLPAPKEGVDLFLLAGDG